MSAAAEAIG